MIKPARTCGQCEKWIKLEDSRSNNIGQCTPVVPEVVLDLVNDIEYAVRPGYDVEAEKCPWFEAIATK